MEVFSRGLKPAACSLSMICEAIKSLPFGLLTAASKILPLAAAKRVKVLAEIVDEGPEEGEEGDALDDDDDEEEELEADVGSLLVEDVLAPAISETNQSMTPMCCPLIAHTRALSPFVSSFSSSCIA